MESIWKKNKAKYGSLNQDIKRECVVVGGGIAGFLAAYRLSESGRKVTLIEAGSLFSGVTRNTTAHIDALHTLYYSALAKKSYSKAKQYYESQVSAIDEYEKLIARHNIDCDFKRQTSFVFTEANTMGLNEEYKALKSINAKAEYAENTTVLGESVGGALNVKGMAIFEPIKFLTGLPISFEVFENTKIIGADFKRKTLFAENGVEINADIIVIATNFPIFNIPGWYFLKMYKSTSYAVAADHGQDLGGIYQTDADSGLTSRNQLDSVIKGGLDHRTGRTDDFNKYGKLGAYAMRLTNGGEKTYKWSANDCMTFDGMPFVGRYSKKSDGIYVITGFNKFGMANAMTASMLICDMINGKGNPYESLFCPQRIIINSEFFKNTFCILKNLLIKPLLPPLKSYKCLKNDEGAIVMYRFSKRAVYKDEKGELHICKPLCPHLKCELAFNPNDKTWDCPCHGSRFDIDGNLFSTPSIKNLEKVL